ncbi:MAG TPA: hypothetical protein VNK05_03975 [Chloroflexota bacterium]|jgi:chromosome segregation ATPase|nr:hypothetical protein [Chloroflexota bacterium]
MDTSSLGVVTLVVALVALGLGLIGAVLGGRARSAQRALGREVAQLRGQIESLEDASARLKDAVETLSGDSGPARQEAAAQVARLEAMGRVLEGWSEDLEAAGVRADGLDARIRILEGRLRDHASEPPPIPSGRRPGRLEDLRAVLRAQAVEEVEQAEAAARAKLGQGRGAGAAPEATEAS